MWLSIGPIPLLTGLPERGRRDKKSRSRHLDESFLTHIPYGGNKELAKLQEEVPEGAEVTVSGEWTEREEIHRHDGLRVFGALHGGHRMKRLTTTRYRDTI